MAPKGYDPTEHYRELAFESQKRNVAVEAKMAGLGTTSSGAPIINSAADWQAYSNAQHGIISATSRPSTTFSMNYQNISDTCAKIDRVVSGLQQTNASLQSTISRLSNCRGTPKNPHDHSAEIAGYQATINQNNKDIAALNSLKTDLQNLKTHTITIDNDLVELLNNAATTYDPTEHYKELAFEAQKRAEKDNEASYLSNLKDEYTNAGSYMAATEVSKVLTSKLEEIQEPYEHDKLFAEAMSKKQEQKEIIEQRNNNIDDLKSVVLDTDNNNNITDDHHFYDSPYIEETKNTLIVKNPKDIQILPSDQNSKFGYLTYKEDKFKINYSLREKNGTYIDPLYKAYAKTTSFYQKYDWIQYEMNTGDLEGKSLANLAAGGIQNIYLDTTLYKYNNENLAKLTFEIKAAQPANPYEPDDTNVSEQPLYNGILYIDESGKYCIANPTDDIEKRNAEEMLNDMGKEKW